MKYIMVTIQNQPFSKIGEFKEQYPKRLINNNILTNNLVPNTECIFVNKTIKKQFIGKFYSINEPLGDYVSFNIKIEREIQYEEKFAKYIGWNVLPEVDFIFKIKNSEESDATDSQFLPPFFTQMLNSDFREFEEQTYYLLKSMGINEIIKIKPDKAQGKPDGVFKIGNFAVIYDAKLSQSFRNDSQQLDNYCAQLNKGIFKYDNKTISFTNSTKSVWIITRGKDELIIDNDSILVKEVTIKKLIGIYLERLKNNLNEHDLVQKLINI